MSRTLQADWLAAAKADDTPALLRMVERIRAGVPFSEVRNLMDRLGMTQEEAASALNIPQRTFARRKETSGRLALGEGERLARFARIMAHAADTLGSLEKAKVWVKAPNRALGGLTPLGLLDTEVGAQAVEEVLGRIEFGVYS